jgi:hypothetical protein
MAKKKQRSGPGSGKSESSKGAVAAAAATLVPRKDMRRWIYAALDVVFGIIYLLVVTRLAMTQSTLDRMQLLTLPLAAGVMGAGMLISGKYGWWLAVGGCAALLLSAVLVIARILISISFLAAVYGGFGKAASSFALLAVALVVELVVLLPLFQLRYLLSRAGRRTLGVAPPLPTVQAT